MYGLLDDVAKKPTMGQHYFVSHRERIARRRTQAHICADFELVPYLMSVPSRLTAAMAEDRVLAIVGAGISVLPPAALPSWWGFNNALFDVIKRRALELVPDATALLEPLTLDGTVPVVAFSELVVGSFAGRGYFPLLAVLESASPNANHRALASLARRGVTDIVTPNFDTMLERAFRDADVPVHVCVRPQDYSHLNIAGGRGRLIHKIHGSVTDESTLIDTVHQKARGLPAATRAVLTRLFRERHLLIVGFSGADFDFDVDYLPMQANAEGGMGFTWVYRAGTEPPNVARRLAASGGELVPDELPGLFASLGVDPSLLAVPPSTAGVDPMAAVRAEIERWSQTPFVGGWACAALCLRLIYATGNATAARALEDVLGRTMFAEIAAQRFSPQMGTTARQIALGSLVRGELSRSVAWSAQELAFHDTLRKANVDSKTGSAPENVEEEYLRNTAAVYNNIGLARFSDTTRDEHLVEAKGAFEVARDRAEQLFDFDLLAVSTMNLAKLATEPAEEWFRSIRRSRGYATVGGSTQTILETCLLEAQRLLEGSELSLAEDLLARAEQLQALSVDSRTAWKCNILKAELAARRGSADEALTILEDIGAKLSDDLLREETAKRAIIFTWFYRESSARLSALVRTLLAGRSESSLWPSVEHIDREEFPRLPLFLGERPASVSDEPSMRFALGLHEFAGDAAEVARVFEHLCKDYHQRGIHDRLADLAIAFERAAVRAGDTARRAIACNYLGIAYDLLGDLPRSAQAYRRALAQGPSDETRPLLQANLAHTLSQLGEVDTVADLFKQARKGSYEFRDWNNYMIATMNFARHLNAHGESAAAAQMIEDDLPIARQAPQAETRVPQLERLIERLRAGLVSSDSQPTAPADRISQEQLEEMRKTAQSAPAIATLAMYEDEAGNFDEALHLNHVAREQYIAEGNTVGASRCWNNLAFFMSRQKRWNEAIEATRKALALRTSADDIDGRRMTVSNLAGYYSEAGRHEDALRSAVLCLELATSAPRSWEVAAARFIQLKSLMLLERFHEAETIAPLARAAARNSNDPRRQQLLTQLANLEHVLDRVREAASRTDEHRVSAAVTATISQARDLTRAGDQRGAIALLDGALAADSLADIDRATLLGELGNRLVATSEIPRARDCYAKAVMLYEQTGATGMAWHARGVSAVALREQGALDEAAAEMIYVLDHCPIYKVRANVVTGYATLAFKRIEGGADIDSSEMDDVERRLEDTLEYPNVPAEELGRAALQLAQVYLLRERQDRARTTVVRAGRWLVQSNSRLLDQLGALEAQLA